MGCPAANGFDIGSSIGGSFSDDVGVEVSSSGTFGVDVSVGVGVDVCGGDGFGVVIVACCHCSLYCCFVGNGGVCGVVVVGGIDCVAVVVVVASSIQ